MYIEQLNTWTFTLLFTMEKINYQKQLDKILESVSKQNIKPSLLLHACCGPCSSYVLEYLMKYFDITIYYYNPNIHPEAEYVRRLNELKTFLPRFDKDKLACLYEENYNPEEFFKAVNTEIDTELKTESEKGERCRRCYKFRMEKAYDFAIRNNFDWFTTTLSISPFKDAQKINVIGQNLQKQNENGPKFLTSDFKKKGGFKRSLELSEEYGLYRQDYCGCIFSKQNMGKLPHSADN